MKLEIDNNLQSYQVAKSLLERREWEEGRVSCETGVKNIDELLIQFEGTPVWNALDIEEVVDDER